MKKYFTIFLQFYIASLLLSQPGQLDETFNSTGKVVTHIANYAVDNSGLLIQEDGKILVCGTAVTASNAKDFVIVRYSSNGILDSTFNQSGIRVIDFFGKLDYCYGMALQSDGKILLTGIATTLSNARKTAVVRLLEDGSFDDTFGTNGIAVNIPDNNSEDPEAIISLADGKIIVAGSIYANLASPICSLFKYNEDGTPDQSFGDNGLATATVPDSYNPAFGIIQHDGKIITGGFLLGNHTDIVMLRFSPQGIIDSTFGSYGIVHTAYANEDHFAYSILLQPDHKILIVDGVIFAGKREFGMLRYNENGALDSTFGMYGRVITAFSSGSNTAHAISIQDDQKILLAGFLGTTPQHNFALARYTSDGMLDAGFGNGGKIITDFGNDDLAFTMAIQSDKKIVLAGHSIDNAGNDDFALTRYLSGLEIVGTTQPVSDIRDIVLYPNPILKEAILKFNLSEDQPMIIRLYDLSGKLIQSFSEGIHRSKGENQEKLIFNPCLLPGNYLLNVETRNSTYGIPVILSSQY